MQNILYIVNFFSPKLHEIDYQISIIIVFEFLLNADLVTYFYTFLHEHLF